MDSVSYAFTDFETLAPGGRWQCRVISTMGITGIQVSLRASQDCNVIFEQSSNIFGRWDIIDTFYYLADKTTIYLVQAVSSYAQVVLTNNNESITNFELHTKYYGLNTDVPSTVTVLHKKKTRFDILKGIH